MYQFRRSHIIVFVLTYSVASCKFGTYSVTGVVVFFGDTARGDIFHGSDKRTFIRNWNRINYGASDVIRTNAAANANQTSENHRSTARNMFPSELD